MPNARCGNSASCRAGEAPSDGVAVAKQLFRATSCRREACCLARPHLEWRVPTTRRAAEQAARMGETPRQQRLRHAMPLNGSLECMRHGGSSDTIPRQRRVDAEALWRALHRELVQHGPVAVARLQHAAPLRKFRLVLAAHVLVQLLVQLLEHLADVHSEPVHGGVPVARGVFLERRQHDRQQKVPLLRDQVDDVLVVPQEEGALRDLKDRTDVWTGLGTCKGERYLTRGMWTHALTIGQHNWRVPRQGGHGKRGQSSEWMGLR
eukprot:355664-Chlamydomonas_euryale.AAC.8